MRRAPTKNGPHPSSTLCVLVHSGVFRTTRPHTVTHARRSGMQVLQACSEAGAASSVARQYISWRPKTHTKPQLVAAARLLHQALACGSLLLARCQRTRPSPPGAPTPARSSAGRSQPAARSSRRRRPTRRTCRASTSTATPGTRAPSKYTGIYMHTSNKLVRPRCMPQLTI